MTHPDQEKSVSRSVALPSPTWVKVDAVVTAAFTGNRSAYFAQLVGRDLEARGMTNAKAELHQLVDELATAKGPEAVRAKLDELAMEEVAHA